MQYFINKTICVIKISDILNCYFDVVFLFYRFLVLTVLKKCGPDRFSRFDVDWIQTNKETPRQTDKPNLYLDIIWHLHMISLEFQ